MVNILIFMCENRVVCLVPKRNWFRKTLEGSLDWTYPKEGLKLRICHFLGQNSIFCWNTNNHLKLTENATLVVVIIGFRPTFPTFCVLLLRVSNLMFSCYQLLLYEIMWFLRLKMSPPSAVVVKGGSSWLVNYYRGEVTPHFQLCVTTTMQYQMMR
jgi:hypothetical protein